jgi:hypothetical protein
MILWTVLLTNLLILFVSDLPNRIWGGSLVQFEGLPTYIGGYTETEEAREQ